ncbi:MAG: serine/threonine protein kinase [Rhizobium sp.]|nr:MAG: serine/threonine protein kinase [Rhizobium sp.]
MSDEELIDGIYKLVMCVASGGSSQVWECVEQASTRHLAMKLLKQDVPDFKANKANMKHEADVLKSVEHPLIVKFERFSSSRDATYLVMEYFRAPNVKLQLKADMRSVHMRARTLFEGTCQALSLVHSKGWIHRDIKPDNILMNKAGEIRLVDFSLAAKEVKGFSKLMGGGKIKTIQGTRTYIAPETIRKQTPTFQTDIYSLGIMFFEVLTGRTPFQAPTPEELLRRHLRDEPTNASELNKNVTPEMDRLIFRMLKKKPTDRHSSVDEVLSELKRIRIFKEDITAAVSDGDDNAKSMDELTDIRLDSRADAKLSSMLSANPELARQFAEDKMAKSAAKKANAARVTEAAKVANAREAAKAAAKAGKPGQPAAPPQMAPPPMMPSPMMPMMPGGFAPQPGFPQFPPQPQFGMPQATFPPGALPPGVAPPGMMPTGMPGYPSAPPPGFPPTGMPPGVLPPGMPGSALPPGVAPPTMPPMTALPPGQPVPLPPQAVRPVASPSVQPPARPAPAARPPQPPAAQVRPAAPPKPQPAPANPDELEYMTELPDIL